MLESFFGTPVDARTIAVRRTPETALVVMPVPQSVHAQVFVAQPASSTALRRKEAESLRPYYDWERGDSFWWKTQRPALFSLEQLTREIWAAHLVEVGAILRAGDDPRQGPRGDGYFFKVSRQPTGSPVRDPAGPVIRMNEGSIEEVVTSRATQTVVATFPAFGSNVVWLRLFHPGKERPRHVTALLSEVHSLNSLRDADPGIVPSIAHTGVLETMEHSGHYFASRPAIGVHPNTAIRDALRKNQGALVCAAEIALGLARNLGVAHARGICLGPITLSLLRVHYGLIASDLGLKVQLFAAPGAGPPGETVPAALFDLLPLDDVDRLADRIEGKYVRSPRRDFEGLGFMLEEMLGLTGEANPELLAIAQALATTGSDGADRALSGLRSYIERHRVFRP